MKHPVRPQSHTEKGRKLDLIEIANLLKYRPEAAREDRREYVFRFLRRLERRDGCWYMVEEKTRTGGGRPRLWARESVLEQLRPVDPLRAEVMRRDVDKLFMQVRELRELRRRDAAKMRKFEMFKSRCQDLLADVSALSSDAETT